MSRSIKDLRELIVLSRNNGLSSSVTIINEPLFINDKLHIKKTTLNSISWYKIEAFIVGFNENKQTEWLEEANKNFNRLSTLLPNFVLHINFCNFWLTKINDAKKMQLLEMEFDIMRNKISSNPNDISSISQLLSVVFWEMSTSLNDKYTFLNYLDILSCQHKTDKFKKLLSYFDLPNSTSKTLQCCLCMRALCLSSVWLGVVEFYKGLVDRHDEEVLGLSEITTKDQIASEISLVLKYGYTDVLEYIMHKENLSWTDYKDSSGRNLLILSVSFQNIESVIFLLEKSCMRNIVNNVSDAGNSALHLAVCQNNLPIVKLLTSMGKVDLNIQNEESDNCTPIQIADMYGNKEIVQFLLKNGAKPIPIMDTFSNNLSESNH